MNLCSIWPFAQISGDFYYLDIWQCARYFVIALFKELPLITIREMWGLGLELPGLSLGFYDTISVSSRNLNQVSVSEVTISTTSLLISHISSFNIHIYLIGCVKEIDLHTTRNFLHPPIAKCIVNSVVVRIYLGKLAVAQGTLLNPRWL